jgi:hypothetical protein
MVKVRKDWGFANLVENGKNAVVPNILVPASGSEGRAMNFEPGPMTIVRDFGVEEDVVGVRTCDG